MPSTEPTQLRFTANINNRNKKKVKYVQINFKNTRMTSKAPFSSVSIVDFEQVNIV